MLNSTKLKSFNKRTIDVICEDSLLEAQTGQQQPHSINTIVSQGRDIGVAHRLTTKPLTFRVFDTNGAPTNILRPYTAGDIVDIFTDSANRFGETYYPISGDVRTWQWTPCSLVLFTRNKQRRQIPTMKFTIREIIKCDAMTPDMLAHLTDVTPVFNMTYKTVLKISDPVCDFAPDQSYIGLTSGVDIYASAFRGSNPLTLIL